MMNCVTLGQQMQAKRDAEAAAAAEAAEHQHDVYDDDDDDEDVDHGGTPPAAVTSHSSPSRHSFVADKQLDHVVQDKCAGSRLQLSALHHDQLSVTSVIHSPAATTDYVALPPTVRWLAVLSLDFPINIYAQFF